MLSSVFNDLVVNAFFLTILCVVGYITLYDRIVTILRKFKISHPKYQNTNLEIILVLYTLMVVMIEYFLTDAHVGTLMWVMTMNLQLVAIVFCNLMLLRPINNLLMQLFFLVLMGSTGYLTPAAGVLLIIGCVMLNMTHILRLDDNVIRNHRLFYWLAPPLIGAYLWSVAQLVIKLPTKMFIFTLICYLVPVLFSFLITSLWQQDLITEQNLSSEVMYDGLTHIKNWQSFELSFDHLFRKMERRSQLAMITMDIDDFKAINDTFGHLAGNKVLIGFAGQLQRLLHHTNASYEIYRTGGEEFTIIMPYTDLKMANKMAQQCLTLIRQLEINYEEQLITMTASMGVTCAAASDQSATDVFQRADHNLYLSKERGKNQITVMSVAS